VVACLGEQADGHEGDALAPIADRARFACPQLASVGADQGFAAERVWAAMEDRGVEAFVPPQRTMLPADGEPKTDAQPAALVARERCKSPRGVWSHKQGWPTLRAWSASSSTATGSTAPEPAAPRCSISNCCSAAPR
jgi:hypothetical protein